MEYVVDAATCVSAPYRAVGEPTSPAPARGR